ncbi:MAG TPA: zf-HC2 domain-containing protein [Terriglobia bacterium]|nr:zf-HC2 domain-containing protein [Terriglobia bacterium]
MDKNNLIQFFKFRMTKFDQRPWGCLDESQIAAYADHQYAGREKERMEAHLADCDDCLDQVTFVVRSRNSELQESVPDALLLRAKRLAKAKPEGSTVWVWGKIAAATAVACLAVVTVISLRQSTTVTPVTPIQNPVIRPAQTPTQAVPAARVQRHPAIRGSQKSVFAPTVVSSLGGNGTLAGGIEIRWQPVSGAMDYEVMVLTPEGDQVWKKRTTEASIQLPRAVSLKAGQKYFVTIRAYLTEGKSVQSAPMAFTVGNQ